ncbi:hypothetical protein ANO11243_034690 [Dothideomycetidae sp. 11243]|nr:hypothetical protein ANO11243_034690 [fungal sp. No.11243]
MRCAASRVKCSGAHPCARCQRQGQSCRYHEGPGSTQIVSETALDTSRGDGEQPNDAAQRIGEATQLWTTPHESQPLAFPFLQSGDTPSDFIGSQAHMISSLNWLSPSFDPELTNFEYDLIGSDEQYWQPTVDDNSVQDPPVMPLEPVVALSYTTTDTDNNLPTETSGQTYVDNTGARQPRNGRYGSLILDGSPVAMSLRGSAESPTAVAEPAGFVFPAHAAHALEDPGTENSNSMSVDHYRILCDAFQTHCLSSSSTNVAYICSDFVSLSGCRNLIALYKRHFDPRILPLVHPTYDEDNEESWILELAMAAVGSLYADIEDTESTVALHELLRRVLEQYKGVFRSHFPIAKSLGLVQAKLLNYIGFAYHGAERLQRHQLVALDELVDEFVALKKSLPVLTEIRGTRQGWILAESATRLCHSIWLLEAMCRYHFGRRPQLLLEFADIPLPVNEESWRTCKDRDQHDRLPSLERALTVLYVEKRLLKGIVEFARVLLIHGLFCQTWHVARLLDQPLLRWTPTAQKGDVESPNLSEASWMPQVPLYNQWRNAACDCLDVLHWIANSDIAKSGTESPVVLHLHFARIVLLAPYDAIRDMVKLLLCEDIRHGAAAKAFHNLRATIQRWIMEDQFKARLALVHCGVFFWHARRYSTDAFYEATDAYMATLVVWAYGSFCPTGQRDGRSGRDRQTQSDESWSDVDDISSIRLDRPTDDELVQLFIKRGRTMKATIMGVGDIAGANGPVRMLVEGCRLLSTLHKWPIRKQHTRDLIHLIERCGRGRQWQVLQQGPDGER